MNAQQLIAKFHEKGFKATSQRLAVCEAVLSSKEHPTADQVYRQVKKSHQTLSLATVYQTLHLLTEIGLLQELDFHDRVSRYDPDTSPHINVICEGCGKIEDYEAKNADEEAIKNVLLNYVEKWNNYDREGVLSCLHEDA